MEVSVSFFTGEKVYLCLRKCLREFLSNSKWHNTIILSVPDMDSVFELLQIFVTHRRCKISTFNTCGKEMDLVDF
jgi:hypothetical protein